MARRVADPRSVADLTAKVFPAVIEAAARYRGPLADRSSVGAGARGHRGTGLRLWT